MKYCSICNYHVPYLIRKPSNHGTQNTSIRPSKTHIIVVFQHSTGGDRIKSKKASSLSCFAFGSFSNEINQDLASLWSSNPLSSETCPTCIIRLRGAGQKSQKNCHQSFVEPFHRMTPLSNRYETIQFRDHRASLSF
jgi:hypothetical protein